MKAQRLPIRAKFCTPRRASSGPRCQGRSKIRPPNGASLAWIITFNKRTHSSFPDTTGYPIGVRTVKKEILVEDQNFARRRLQLSQSRLRQGAHTNPLRYGRGHFAGTRRANVPWLARSFAANGWRPLVAA